MKGCSWQEILLKWNYKVNEDKAVTLLTLICGRKSWAPRARDANDMIRLGWILEFRWRLHWTEASGKELTMQPVQSRWMQVEAELDKPSQQDEWFKGTEDMAGCRPERQQDQGRPWERMGQVCFPVSWGRIWMYLVSSRKLSLAFPVGWQCVACILCCISLLQLYEDFVYVTQD
jgi:hypothetical protein